MPKKPIIRSNPEARLQARIIPFMEERGWLVEVMHGNVFQKGIPDLYCWNQSLDISRWIDVKLPKGSKLTKAQCQKWPQWEKVGLGIWVMKEDSEEEYRKLFEPPNWRDMWLPSYEKYIRDIDDILSELDEDE